MVEFKDYGEFKEKIQEMIQKVESTINDRLEEKYKNIIFVDFNLRDNYSKHFAIFNDEIDSSFDTTNGIKIRVWDGQKYLEESYSEFTLDSILDVISRLTEKAKLNLQDYIRKGFTLFQNKKLSEVNSSNVTILKNVESVLDEDFSDKIVKFALKKEEKNALFGSFPKAIGFEKIIALLKEYNDKIKALSDSIVSIRFAIIEEFERTIFINNSKNFEQRIPLFLVIFLIVVKSKDGKKNEIYHSLTDKDLNLTLEKFEEYFKSVPKKIESLNYYQKLKGGRYDVVLSPRLTGLLAHESFGHGMEFDTIFRKRALVREWFGKKIASSDVNIVDFPLITDSKHGTYYFDDEGNLADKTYLIKNGFVSIPLLDNFSKTILGLSKSCNSRAMSYDHKNYIRMSNTFFEHGDKYTFEELISAVKDGIYLFYSDGGMEDPKSWGVQIQGCIGQRIKDGKLINEFYNGITMTGFLPDILSNIKMISKEFRVEGTGHCGKGHKEWVRVSEGGPYLLIKNMILG